MWSLACRPPAVATQSVSSNEKKYTKGQPNAAGFCLFKQTHVTSTANLQTLLIQLNFKCQRDPLVQRLAPGDVRLVRDANAQSHHRRHSAERPTVGALVGFCVLRPPPVKPHRVVMVMTIGSLAILEVNILWETERVFLESMFEGLCKSSEGLEGFEVVFRDFEIVLGELQCAVALRGF